MYDYTCRILAENFSADFASWLIGEAIELTELKPSELSLEPIRADAMILLQSEDLIFHIEFQTLPKKKIPFLEVAIELLLIPFRPSPWHRKSWTYFCTIQDSTAFQ
jgi:predicted transposase YdaD